MACDAKYLYIVAYNSNNGPYVSKIDLATNAIIQQPVSWGVNWSPTSYTGGRGAISRDGKFIGSSGDGTNDYWVGATNNTGGPSFNPNTSGNGVWYCPLTPYYCKISNYYNLMYYGISS